MNRNDVRIASPCGADWTAMTPADIKKRFCDECKKHVHDLSQMTRTEARALLASKPTEGLCVRYLHDERGDIWFAPEAPRLIAPSRLARMKRLAVAATALVAPLSLTACMGAAMPRVEEPRYVEMMGSPVEPTDATVAAPEIDPTATEAPEKAVAAEPQQP